MKSRPDSTPFIDACDLQSRREFLEFFGRSTVALSASVLAPALAGCTSMSLSSPGKTVATPFPPLKPTNKDDLVLAEGFRSRILIRWDEPLNAKGDKFGFNNDYVAFFPLPAGPDGAPEGLLWVNHEAPDPAFVSGYEKSKKMKRTKEQVIAEQLSVGGSIIKIRKDTSGGTWTFVANDTLNRRLHGQTPIRLVSARPIAGKTEAIGTFANCAGGVTPWNTVLTCEENYDNFYGEVVFDKNRRTRRDTKKAYLGWQEFFDYPPEHYGWVVEVDPMTGAAKKLTALGRFAHECATVVKAKDGRCVVYTGDDGDDRCLYKFIAAKPNSLEEGELFVADMQRKQWVSLDIKKQPALQKNYQDQTEVLIRCRESAPLVGGTPLDRPEDIEIDPQTKAVFVTLTNNIKRGNHFGSILKIVEENNDPLSLRFEPSTFLAGGPTTGFACPDNLAFDKRGNLWMTTDMSGSVMGKPPYESFGNNGLFYIPMSGPHAGAALQVASAPRDAELTGPCFSPDGETLFLAVQHPGEKSQSVSNPSSHWPDGNPKPAVVTIDGPALARLV